MALAPPNTNLYMVGKGVLWIGQWTDITPPTDPGSYTRMGNCPSFECQPEVMRLEHFSSQSGYRTRDKYPVIETKYTLTFDLDEFAALNLTKFLVGTFSDPDISMFEGVNLEYAIKFVSDNPTGPNMTWRFWRCVLSPNGALQLIADEWAVMSFTAEGLADVTNHVASPYATITYKTTTTTSTTSSSTTTTAPP